MSHGAVFYCPSFHKRGKIWYVQFKRLDGSYVTAKSTRQKKLDMAKRWANEYQVAGKLNIKDRSGKLDADLNKGLLYGLSGYRNLLKIEADLRSVEALATLESELKEMGLSPE